MSISEGIFAFIATLPPPYVPPEECEDIPEGMGQFTFTIETIEIGAFLSFTQDANDCGGLGGANAYEVLSAEPEVVASLYAAHLESTGPVGTVATVDGATVTVLVPTTEIACGTLMKICTYNGEDNPEQMEPLGLITYPNGQAIECCP